MGVVGWWWALCVSKHKKGVLFKDEPLVVRILYSPPFYLWLPPLLILQLYHHRSLPHSLSY